MANPRRSPPLRRVYNTLSFWNVSATQQFLVPVVNSRLFPTGNRMSTDYAEKYARSVNSSNLQDDEHHHSTEALIAAALADTTGGEVLGSLLTRVKYASPIAHKTFEAGTKNLAQLLAVWEAVVTEKGRSRGWMKIKAEWDIAAAHAIYRKIAKVSLAHWLGGNCLSCGGSKLSKEMRKCVPCEGSGRAPIEGGRLEREKVRDMVSELEGLLQAHNARAAGKMRRAA